MNTDKPAYIGLGSNLGNRCQFIFAAIEQLHQNPSLVVERCSSIYETVPVGMREQPDYLNMVAAVRTSLSPLDLLQLLLTTEQALGRLRNIRWGPRTIDLDLLLYADETVDDDQLELPHPRMWERAFVLIPLLEIWQPDDGPGINVMLKSLQHIDGRNDVQLWRKTNWHSESGRFAN